MMSVFMGVGSGQDSGAPRYDRSLDHVSFVKHASQDRCSDILPGVRHFERIDLDPPAIRVLNPYPSDN